MRSFWKQSTALNPLKREGQNREVPRRSRDALQATAVEEVVEEYLPRWVNDSVSCGWPARSFWGAAKLRSMRTGQSFGQLSSLSRRYRPSTVLPDCVVWLRPSSAATSVISGAENSGHRPCETESNHAGSRIRRSSAAVMAPTHLSPSAMSTRTLNLVWEVTICDFLTESNMLFLRA